MLTIAASVIVGVFAAYFIARSQRHWLLVVVGVFSSLTLFLLIFISILILYEMSELESLNKFYMNYFLVF